jgi:glycosyltransferase involved in cell wall biosynthesis
LDAGPGLAPSGSGRPAPRPLRVLQLAYGHGLYGAERWVLALIKHLDASRVATTVACLRDADTPDLPLIDEARRLGFPTLIIEATRNRLLEGLRGIRAALGSLEIDVVHSHGVRQDLLALLAAWRLPTRTVSTPHGWEIRCSLKERARMLLNKGLFAGFDAVAPLSDDLRDSLRFAPIRRSRIHLIPNGVDLSEIELARPIEGLLPGQAAPGDLLIGYIGQLIPRKGVAILLDALGRLPRTGWSSLIIGEGPDRAALERQAGRLGLRDRVVFLGYRADRLRYLKRFDLFVLPSFLEGTPRCVMEALAAGVPCAASRIPGTESLLQDGVTGDTFPAGDAASLAAIITRHLGRQADARRTAEAGRALVEERYSARGLARAYERLYADLAAGRP